MISILIPVYNVTVYSLVQELSEQLDDLNLKGEIIVFDDGSNDLYKVQNRSVTSLKHVFYQELDKNYGRIRIRQLLAGTANNNWLLFIDADSVILKSKFLSNYFECLSKGYDVYVGGTTYQQEKPSNCSLTLHWKYGAKREPRSHSRRSNNFLIAKEIFSKLNFPESLIGYGHEDTWIQIELRKKNRKILLIDNPVQHAGLEATPVFLEKTKNALRNLVVLVEVAGKEEIRRTVALYKLYLLLRELGCISLVRSILKKRIEKINKNLNSCNPSLLQFDLYRLYYLIERVRNPVSEKLPRKN